MTTMKEEQMKTFTVRMRQYVYYEVEVKATSRVHAIAIIRRKLEEGDEPLSINEVDTGPWEIETREGADKWT
jgi:hypothetical protein